MVSNCFPGTKKISIHAPTRGATSILPQGHIFHKFQSTLPRGERRLKIFLNNLQKHFNPRSHEGSDMVNLPHLMPRSYFNPRSHEGSDYFPRRTSYSSYDFNPRSHEGSDASGSGCASPSGISIHAPTRGATLGARQGTCITLISIHAPTRGATSIFAKKFYFLLAKIV